ncbi:hypothetical protein ACIQXX_26190 [Bacillus cereus]|uniref:hypothetical protein n=1 Tax=Bacillus cereus TaxID=1396 RepID=UPI00380C2364
MDINRFEKIKPPKKYEDYQFLIQEGLEVEQKKIKQAMDNYWNALQLLSEALEEQNDNNLEQAENKAEQAMKLFKKATESIKSKTN